MLITTSSLYDKYKGSDGISRNTAFNGNYMVNSYRKGMEYRQKGKKQSIRLKWEDYIGRRKKIYSC